MTQEPASVDAAELAELRAIADRARAVAAEPMPTDARHAGRDACRASVAEWILSGAQQTQSLLTPSGPHIPTRGLGA